MNPTTAKNLMSLTKESYEKVADSFSDTRNFSWLEIDEAIKKYLKPGIKILDLGCGNGRLLKSLETLGSFSYTGLDSCQALIDKAQDPLFCHPELDSGSRKIKFIHNDILDLSQFSDNEFDVVFMVASFNHIPGAELQEKLLLDIQKILKPKGFLIMTNWNLWNVHNKKSVWHRRCLQSPDWRHNASSLQSGDWRQPKIPFFKGMTMRDVITLWQNQFPIYYHAFTLCELKKLLQKTNLKILANYYVKDGKKTYWFNGKNILTIAQKI